jgi:hypothetical protein
MTILTRKGEIANIEYRIKTLHERIKYLEKKRDSKYAYQLWIWWWFKHAIISCNNRITELTNEKTILEWGTIVVLWTNWQTDTSGNIRECHEH